MRRAVQTIACVLDLAWIALSVLIVFVIVSGGGEYRWAGRLIRIRSVENPLLAWQLMALIRLVPLQHVPFLLRTRWELGRVAAQSLELCRRAGAALTAPAPARARRVLWLLIGVVTLAKLANAALYPGFFSGDDVEIHEMTFSALFGQQWTAWDLRSPFYPMAFIYPAQALLARVGIADTGTLILAGRVVVALLSSVSVWLVFRAGEALESRGVGVAAAIMFGVHRLHVTFGGSELPRPVASVFVLGAFVCLIETPARTRRALLAGALLAVGGAMRFGELAFVVPAAAVAYFSSGLRPAVAVVLSFGVVAVLVLGGSDLWYWGSPFHSLQRVVEFTLIDRLSSRGYQPPWYYVSALTSWTSLTIAGLALYGAQRSRWRLTLWWGVPLMTFSLLPHKEPRYLIAVLPFVCLSAALGLHRALGVLAGRSAPIVRLQALAVSLVVLCCGGFLLEIGGWRFRKPTGPVETARFVDASGCSGGVVVEQRWRVGGRLYLRRCGFTIDLEPEVASNPAALRTALDGSAAEWVLLKNPLRDEQRAVLDQQGFGRVSVPDQTYTVERRVRPLKSGGG